VPIGREIGHQMLETRVLVLELLELTQLAHSQMRLLASQGACADTLLQF
jgi:hypothetical protein